MSEENLHNPRLDQAGASDDSLQDVHAALLREKPEPSEGTVPIPLLLLAVICVTVFVSGVYWGRYGWNKDIDNALTYNEDAVQGGGALAAGPVQVDPVVLGKRLYTQNCLQCHQPSGLGAPGAYPPLAGSEWVNGTEERTVRILLAGLGGPITVAGNQFGSMAMPAFGPLGANWRDDRIAAVLTYVRQEWGNKSGPVTAEQVAKIRAAASSRTKAWTADELLQLGK
jgi:mono/diheme cytochrome c family protein